MNTELKTAFFMQCEDPFQGVVREGSAIYNWLVDKSFRLR